MSWKRICWTSSPDATQLSHPEGGDSVSRVQKDNNGIYLVGTAYIKWNTRLKRARCS